MPPYPLCEGVSDDFQDYLLDLPSEEYSNTRNVQKRVWFGVNGSAYHSLPITVNLWNNWILNDIINDDIDTEDRQTITSSMHPLPVTTKICFPHNFQAF